VTGEADLPTSRRRRLAWIVRGALVFVGVAPFFRPLAGPIPALEPLARALDVWFAYQCHRDPGRTLFWLGSALPVCIRCLGIYEGLGLGGLVAWPRLGAVTLRVWVGSAAALMVVDVLAERAGIHPPWPLIRLISGALLAYPVGVTLVHAARQG
jgi:uncharacterized membrane protein